MTREQIVAEALVLLRQEGLAAVSLRKIAARLAVKAPSLYWHVDSKEALYGLMSQAIFRRCLEAIPACEDWREWLREFGLSLWRTQLATPDIRKLIVIAPVDAELRRLNRVTIVDALAGLGLDASLATPAQQSIQALVTGWTTLSVRTGKQESELRFLESLDVLIDGWRARAGSSARLKSSQAYP